MTNLSILVGILLVLLGVASYVSTGAESATALIPAGFGFFFLLLGVLGRSERRTRMSMHLATGLALLGLAGSVRGVPQALTMLRGESVERPAAAAAQTLMALLCLIFLALSIRFFLVRRRSSN